MNNRNDYNQRYYNNNNNNYHPYRQNNYNGNSRPNSNRNSKQDKYRIINESSAQFNIHPYSIYDQPFPKFQQPVEIGSILSESKLIKDPWHSNSKYLIQLSFFKLKERKTELEKRVKNDPNYAVEFEKTRGVKFLVLPDDCKNCNFDLKLGVDQFVEHIPHQHGIDSILKWLMENKQKVINVNKEINRVLKPEFICWRGLLTTLLVTPYENQKDWMFTLIKYKGSLYMCEIETEINKNERVNKDEKTKSFTYWGHKFESYITADLPNEEAPGSNEVPDPENNYGTVVMGKLNENYMLYCAEIDCCLGSEHKSLKDYCEIKTHKGNSINDLNFDRNMKFLKWWLQSFLVDIEILKVGLRNDDGIVNKIIDCKVSDIYKYSTNKRWKESLCFNFMASFFDFLKLFCTDEQVVYVVKKQPGMQFISINKLEKSSEDFKEKYFLRDWYTSII